MAHMAQVALTNLKRQHDTDAAEMKRLDKQSAKAAENFSEYTKQKLENEMVLKELAVVGDEAAVFKKIGPCLVKQDKIEARHNVEKRIEYITNELERIEKQKGLFDDKRRNIAQGLQKVQEKVQQIMHQQTQQGELAA